MGHHNTGSCGVVQEVETVFFLSCLGSTIPGNMFTLEWRLLSCKYLW